MIRIKVTCLTGRYFASHPVFGNRKEEAEWPPEPSRLFSALVAMRQFVSDRALATDALTWLERQSAPTILTPPVSYQKRNLTKFVPANDHDSLKGKSRNQSRKNPSVGLAYPDIWFEWPQSEAPEEVKKGLAMLLVLLHRLGNSQSLVCARICTEESENLQKYLQTHNYSVWSPTNQMMHSSQYIYCTYPGRLEELEVSNAKFEKTGLPIYRPKLGLPTPYTVQTLSPTPIHKPASGEQGCFSQMRIFSKEESDLPLEGTYLLTSAIRKAILANCPQPIPESISGHTSSGEPTRLPHIAIVPCPHVGGLRGDGCIKGFAILEPNGMTEEDKNFLSQALVAASVHGVFIHKGLSWSISGTTPGQSGKALSGVRWTKPSQHWATVTPFVFGRYPRDLESQQTFDAVVEACRQVGLPDPIQVEIHQIQPHIKGVPRAKAFSGKPVHKNKFHAHLKLTFPHLVQGPIVLGSGRFYGFGLCAPLDHE